MPLRLLKKFRAQFTMTKEAWTWIEMERYVAGQGRSVGHFKQFFSWYKNAGASPLMPLCSTRSVMKWTAWPTSTTFNVWKSRVQKDPKVLWSLSLLLAAGNTRPCPVTSHQNCHLILRKIPLLTNSIDSEYDVGSLFIYHFTRSVHYILLDGHHQ